MKSLRVPVESLVEGEQPLDQAASHYVLRVHRLRVGAPVVLFDALLGLEAAGTLLRATSKNAVCHVGAIRKSEAVPSCPITLVQALAKGDKVDRVIGEATALGVGEVVVVATSRCTVRSDGDGDESRRRRWLRIAIDAARQSGRGNVPTIVGPSDLRACLAHVATCGLRLSLSPYADVRFTQVLLTHAPQPIVVFIGPEGGLASDEEAALLAAGFAAVRFGDFTLRTETCATAVLGALVDWGAK